MKNLKFRNIYCYLIILLVSIIMCIPLFQFGVHTGHDGDYHISRTLGTIEQITNGTSPFIISRFSNNLGYGWNLFYPPLSTAMNVVFAFLTSNVVTAMKIFIFITFIFSGISMFKLVKTISNNNIAALLSGIFYMIAPYRLLNTYTRLAIGEMISFIFIPIILRGVYLILHGDTKKSYLFILGTIGLILSHNISTLLTFFLGFFYVLINLDKLKDKKIFKTLCISTCIIILSVLFFEVPLLEQKSSCEYEVFRYGKMYSNTSVMGHALNPLQLLFKDANGADSSMYFCIGIPILFGLILTPFVHKTSSLKKEYIFLLIVGIISSIMATFVFPWFLMPDILLMVQFPWRMLILIVCCFSIISGINISIFMKNIIEKSKQIKFSNFKYFDLVANICVISIIIVLSTLYSMSFISNLDMEYKDNDFYRTKEEIDPVNEVSKYSAFLEYWPQKAVRSLEYIINRDNKVALLSGNANIQNEENNNGILDFEINNVQDNTSLELPYLFYKGYQVTYTPINSTDAIKLDCTESDKGLVQVNLNTSINGTIHVEYHVTLLHKICICISFVTMFSYLIYLLVDKLRNRKSTEDVKLIGSNSTNLKIEKNKISI